MADQATMLRLREVVASHLVAIADLFVGPRKISILIRDPRHPDGSRDVYLSDDDAEMALTAIRQVVATGQETKRERNR